MKKFAALMLSLIMIGTVTTGCTLPGIMPKSSSEVNSTSSNSSKEIVSSEKPQVDSSPSVSYTHLHPHPCYPRFPIVRSQKRSYIRRPFWRYQPD